MRTDFFRVRSNTSIKELADKFANNYYSVIDKMSANIKKYTAYIPEVLDMEIVEFKKRAKEVGERIKEHMLHREEVLIPYLHELSEKKNTGHNCANCSANCSVEHNMKVNELAASIKELKTIAVSIADDLQNMSNIQKDIALKVLCNELHLINGMMTELVLLEEEVLLPGIVEAQKSINAYN